MDRPFISKMCEAYYNDFELHKEHIWQNKDSAILELNNFIYQEIDIVKFTNIPLYEEVFKLGRDQQYRIIYNLLDDYINEKYELDTKKIEEEAFTAIGTVGGFVGGFLGGAIDTIISVVSGAFTTVTSAFGIPIGMFIIMVAIFFGIKHITFVKAKAAVLLNDAFTAMRDFVRRVTVSSRLENSIIFSNLEACGSRCGIRNFKDIHRFTTFSLRGMDLSEEARVQAKCLFGCFIESIHKLVEVCGKAYINCLKNSGDKMNLNELTAVNVLLKPPSSSQCNIFYLQLKKFDREFREAIDTLSATQDDRDKFIADYNRVLDNALQSSSKQEFPPRSFPPKPFSPKPFSPKPFHNIPKR